MVPVSLLVTAKNEEEMLPGALASAANWVQEMVVVVDAESKDGTAATAQQWGAKVFLHPFRSSGQQINWGLELCTQPWILVLDADERLTPPLKEAIARELAAPRFAAYALRRRNWALGRKVRFGDWGWDWVVRLVRASVRWQEKEVHALPIVQPVGRLRGEIDHYTFRSFPQYLPKVVEYAWRGARQAKAEGRKSSVFTALARAEWRFLRSFVLRLGFLDGSLGFLLAVLAAYGTFLKWASLWAGLDEGRARFVQ
jgi:glycosyltransferase involved in cell wall biosynthesis